MGELEPEISAQEIPRTVASARAEYARLTQTWEEVLRPRIEGHLLVFDDLLDGLVGAHRDVVEHSDVEIGADTRWAAIWEISGRCLGLAKLFVAELRLGFTAETAGTIRVTDEAVHLLHAVASEEGEAVLRRWLRGRTIMPRDVRSVEQRIQRRVAEALREQGVDVEGDIAELGRGVYNHLSQAAHNARQGFADSVSRGLRAFTYGPHSDFRHRAVYVDYGSELIESVVIGVGHGLARFYGGDWYRDTIRPMQEELEATRQALPVDAAARAQLGY